MMLYTESYELIFAYLYKSYVFGSEETLILCTGD